MRIFHQNEHQISSFSFCNRGEAGYIVIQTDKALKELERVGVATVSLRLERRCWPKVEEFLKIFSFET